MMRWFTFGAALAFALLCSGVSPAAVGERGAQEKSRTRSEPGLLEPAAGPWIALLKLGLAAAAIAAASAGVVWAQRRILSRGPRRGFAAGTLRVLARAALSPKHFVWVVEFRDREILVGGSPDRLELLAIFEREPAAPAVAREENSGLERSGESLGGPSEKPRRIQARDLLPYRRQVERLRGLLRAGEGAPLSPREKP